MGRACNVTVTLVPARHASGRGLFDAGRTLWTGYVAESGGRAVYYSGDTSWGDHLEGIAKKFSAVKFDAAFIENGQYDESWPDYHMFPEETAKAVKSAPKAAAEKKASSVVKPPKKKRKRRLFLIL